MLPAALEAQPTKDAMKTETKQEAKHSPLPCPFCGHDAVICGETLSGTPIAHCESPTCFFFKSGVPVTDWNARAANPLFSEMRDALEAVISANDWVNRIEPKFHDNCSAYIHEEYHVALATQHEAITSSRAILAKVKEAE